VARFSGLFQSRSGKRGDERRIRRFTPGGSPCRAICMTLMNRSRSSEGDGDLRRRKAAGFALDRLRTALAPRALPLFHQSFDRSDGHGIWGLCYDLPQRLVLSEQCFLPEGCP